VDEWKGYLQEENPEIGNVKSCVEIKPGCMLFMNKLLRKCEQQDGKFGNFTEVEI
jgi:hypothetical protein